MHISVRKLKGCKRKKNKALAVSLSIDDLAWSGNPVLPIQTQSYFDNTECSIQCTIPDTAIFTPFDIPNPTDYTPTLLDNSQLELSNIFHADISQTLPVLQFDDFSVEMLRACEQGDGCEPAQEYWAGDASSMAACRLSAPPISGMEIGHGRHSASADFSVTIEAEWRPCSCRHLDFIDGYQKVETRQVASQCNRRAPITSCTTHFTTYQPLTSSPDGIFHGIFSLDLAHPSMYTNGYVINLTAWDSTNNYNWMEVEVDGLFTGVFDFLATIWNSMVGVFSAVAGAVASAMSVFADIIIGNIMTLLQPIFDQIDAAMENDIALIGDGLKGALDEMQKANPSAEWHGDKAALFLFSIILAPLLLFTSLGLVFVYAETLAKLAGPFFPVILGAILVAFTLFMSYLIIKLGMSTIPSGSNPSGPELIVSNIPSEVWWSARAPLAVTSFAAKAGILITKTTIENPSRTAVGIGLTILSFFIFMAAGIIDNPWVQLLAPICGGILSWFGFFFLLTDPASPASIFIWGLALAFSLTSVTIGSLNMIRAYDLIVNG